MRKDAARNREAILDAAVEVLEREPDASVDEIAEAAGVSRATLYRHFRTREDIVDALREEAEARGAAFVAESLGPLLRDLDGLSVLDLLDEMLWNMLTLESRYRRLMTADPRRGEEIVSRFTEIAEATIRRGQERGQIVDDVPPPLLTRQLIAIALATLRAIDEGTAAPEDAAASLRRYINSLRPTASVRTA